MDTLRMHKTVLTDGAHQKLDGFDSSVKQLQVHEAYADDALDNYKIIDYNNSELSASFEGDSKWRPHLNWNFLSWNLQQQKVNKQANQREIAWQKVADKLGPLLSSSTTIGHTFGANSSLSPSAEECHEKVPFLSSSKRNLVQKRKLLTSKRNIEAKKFVSRGTDAEGFTLNGRCHSVDDWPDRPGGSSSSFESDLPSPTPSEQLATFVVRQSPVSLYGGLGRSTRSLASSANSIQHSQNNNCDKQHIAKDDESTYNGAEMTAYSRATCSPPLLTNFEFSNNQRAAFASRQNPNVPNAFNLDLNANPRKLYKANYNNNLLNVEEAAQYYYDYRRAKTRCVIVSGTIVALIILLFALITLMALGILPR